MTPAAGRLIEKKVRVLANVEGLPIEQRLLLLLHNRDVRFGAARGLSR